MGNFPLGEKVPAEELVRGNFTLREFARNSVQNHFDMPCFLFSVSVLRGGDMGNWPGSTFTGIELSNPHTLSRPEHNLHFTGNV